MATINSVCVVISGLVEGNIRASEQIVLHKTARVSGDLEAPIVIMEEGAQLNGGLKMGKISGSEKAQNALKGSPDVVASNGGGSSN